MKELLKYRRLCGCFAPVFILTIAILCRSCQSKSNPLSDNPDGSGDSADGDSSHRSPPTLEDASRLSPSKHLSPSEGPFRDVTPPSSSSQEDYSGSGVRPLLENKLDVTTTTTAPGDHLHGASRLPLGRLYRQRHENSKRGKTQDERRSNYRTTSRSRDDTTVINIDHHSSRDPAPIYRTGTPQFDKGRRTTQRHSRKELGASGLDRPALTRKKQIGNAPVVKRGSHTNVNHMVTSKPTTVVKHVSEWGQFEETDYHRSDGLPQRRVPTHLDVTGSVKHHSSVSGSTLYPHMSSEDENTYDDVNAIVDEMEEEEVDISPPPPINDYSYLNQIKTDEQKLLEHLMHNYQNAVRPVINASTSVNVKVGLTLNQLDVEEKNQVLTTLVWLDQEWQDEKLRWNPINYNNVTVFRIPCIKLWLPDIVLYNSVQDMKGGYMQALAMVQSDGTVFWPPIVKFKGNCIIDIQYFPFDDQLCKLKLGSWTYDGSQVNISILRQGIDLSNYVKNGEWSLVKVGSKRNVVHYSCCPEPYMDVTFEIHLRRRTLYYTYNIIIPCVMLSTLTLLCFWMKPDSGEKVTLGLTVLLSMSVFMLLIADNMPPTSFNVPIIGVYITSSMCIIACSVIVAVFVSNINYQATGDKVVPRWLHQVAYGLSKVTCVKMPSWEQRHCGVRQLVKSFTANAKTEKGYPNTKLIGKTANGNRAHRSGVNGVGSMGTTTAKNPAESLLKRLYAIVEQQEEMLKKQSTHEDWHLVANVVDRCLFWIYFVMIFSATMFTLVIYPATKVVDSEGEELIGY